MAGPSVNRSLAGTTLARVISLPGQHMPHAPLGIRGITFVTGDHMNMDMVDTLSRGGIDISAYVVAIGTEFFVQFHLFDRDQVHAGSRLFWSEVEEVSTVSKRDNQGMTRADGVAVARAVRQPVTPCHPPWCAKKARVVRITHR